MSHQEAVEHRLQQLRTESARLYKNPVVKMETARSLTSLKVVLEAWDKGNTRTRERILRQFLHEHRGSTGPQLERAFSNGASLLLMRFSAWLRLTFLFGELLALKLTAISVFLAASGHRYLAEFLEVGGVVTVVAILRMPGGKEEDRRAAIAVLELMCAGGRVYKELVCEADGDGQGVVAVAECLETATESSTKEAARNLLYHLGTGNPRCLPIVREALLARLSCGQSDAQQMASYILRLLMPLAPPTEQFIHPVLLMCRSMNLHVQYEASELVRLLAADAGLRLPMVKALVSLLRPPRDVTTLLTAQDFKDPGEGQFSDANTKGFLARTENRVVPAAFPQQAAAANLLASLCKEDPAVTRMVVDHGGVQGLLVSLANVMFPEGQQAAKEALMVVFQQLPGVADRVERALGRASFTEIMQEDLSISPHCVSELQFAAQSLSLERGVQLPAI